MAILSLLSLQKMLNQLANNPRMMIMAMKCGYSKMWKFNEIQMIKTKIIL